MEKGSVMDGSKEMSLCHDRGMELRKDMKPPTLRWTCGRAARRIQGVVTAKRMSWFRCWGKYRQHLAWIPCVKGTKPNCPQSLAMMEPPEGVGLKVKPPAVTLKSRG